MRGAQLSDEPTKVTQIMTVLRTYSSQHYQTHGREVGYVDYEASWPSEDDEAMKRDAINIAAKIPFAVIEGDPAPGKRSGDEGVLINIYRSRIATLFRGVHMAGPNLTHQSWIQGTLNYPRAGGTPDAPHFFLTRQTRRRSRTSSRSSMPPTPPGPTSEASPATAW